MKSEKEILVKARELRAEGYSYQEIADTLDSSKATIYRLLSEGTKTETSQERSETVQNSRNNWETDTGHWQLKQREMELAHEREMYKLKQKDKELEIEKMKAYSLIDERREKQEREQQQFERQKKFLLNKFHKYLNILKDQCFDYEWDWNDLETFIKQIAKLKDEIEEFATLNTDDDYKEVGSWVFLQSIEGRLQGCIEEAEEYYEREEQRNSRYRRNEERNDNDDDEDEDEDEERTVTVDFNWEERDAVEGALLCADILKLIK
mgnify:CR=1 FL=1